MQNFEHNTMHVFNLLQYPLRRPLSHHGAPQLSVCRPYQLMLRGWEWLAAWSAQGRSCLLEALAGEAGGQQSGFLIGTKMAGDSSVQKFLEIWVRRIIVSGPFTVFHLTAVIKNVNFSSNPILVLNLN